MPESDSPPNPKNAETITIRLPDELKVRIGIAAEGARKSLNQFVIEVLDERTKDHKEDVARVVEREKVPKKWS